MIDAIIRGEHTGPGVYFYYDRHGNYDSFTVSERQANILQKKPSQSHGYFTSAERAEREAVMAELNYYKDIKKDPEYLKNTGRIEIPRRFR